MANFDLVSPSAGFRTLSINGIVTYVGTRLAVVLATIRANPSNTIHFRDLANPINRTSEPRAGLSFLTSHLGHPSPSADTTAPQLGHTPAVLPRPSSSGGCTLSPKLFETFDEPLGRLVPNRPCSANGPTGDRGRAIPIGRSCPVV